MVKLNVDFFGDGEVDLKECLVGDGVNLVYLFPNGETVEMFDGFGDKMDLLVGEE